MAIQASDLSGNKSQGTVMVTVSDDQLLAVSNALDKLAAQDPIEAELVKLRYFVVLTVEEAAALLDTSPRTARNYCAHARSRLYHEIEVRSEKSNHRVEQRREND